MLIRLMLCLFIVPIHAGESPEALVKRFVAAFNAHDVKAMSELVTDDVSWLYLAGNELVIESKSKEELVKGMNSYFKALPDVRSEIGPTVISGVYVALEERAIWKNKDGVEKSQAAMAVYETHAGKIRRVWYYPAHK